MFSYCELHRMIALRRDSDGARQDARALMVRCPPATCSPRPQPTGAAAISNYWLNLMGNVYYQDFSAMQRDGIIDPSDFIDYHRYSRIGSNRPKHHIASLNVIQCAAQVGKIVYWNTARR